MRVAALLAVLLAHPACAGSRSAYRQGVAAFESGNIAGARRWLAEVDPREEPHAAFLLGVVAGREKNWAEAIARFDVYLTTVPPTADLVPAARAHRVYVLAGAGRVDEATSYLATAPATPDRTTTFLLGYADLVVAKQAKQASDRAAAARRAESRFAHLGEKPGSADAEALNALGLARLARATLVKAPAERKPLLSSATAAFTRAARLSAEGDPIHQSAMRGLGKAKDLAR